MEELRILKAKTPKDLWHEDLDSFIGALNVSAHRCVYVCLCTCVCTPCKWLVYPLQEIEEQEKQQRASDSSIKLKGKAKKGSRQAKLTSHSSAVQTASKPSPFAEVIPPQIPEFKIPAEKKERKPKVAHAKPKGGGGGGGLKQGKLLFKEAEMKTASVFDEDSSEETAFLGQTQLKGGSVPTKRQEDVEGSGDEWTASKRKVEKEDSSEDEAVAVRGRKRAAPQKKASKKVFSGVK